ncbi:MAG: hypothetical protein ACR5KV_02615 [Wolbachia sp.]
MRGKLKNIEYKSEFSMYSSDLEHQFKIGVQRLGALNTGKKVIKHFDSLGEGPFNLKITEYLSNEYMRNLRKVAIQAMDQETLESLDNVSAVESVRDTSYSIS